MVSCGSMHTAALTVTHRIRVRIKVTKLCWVSYDELKKGAIKVEVMANVFQCTPMYVEEKGS